MRRGRALGFGLAMLGLALASPGVAAAQPPAARAEPALVVVISNTPDAPFVRRLAAELSLFGYRVEVVARATNDDDLAELLARSRGAALIAVDQGVQTAEVVVGAGVGSGPARRERERLDPRRRADTNAAVLAERFRARLTELGISPGGERELPVAVAAAPVESAQPPAREAERRLWLAGAFGASSGGFGLLPDVQLELRAFPVRWLSTSAFGKWTPGSAHVSAREGEADVRLLSGGVLIDAYPFGSDHRLSLGLGALLVSASMSGRAAAPWGGRNDSVLVPAALLDAGLALPVSARMSAELRGFVGVCSPGVAVRFGGREVAKFGQPFVGVSFGLALGVF